jgi:uncharacterized damage-inducible protein DinB
VSEVSRLVDQLERDHSGEPWHGSPVLAQLEGLTAEQAARPGPGGAHSIWEIVLHMTAWKEEVARRATGAPAAAPPQGDWPAVGAKTLEAWRQAVADLTRAHEGLISVVRGLTDDALWQPTNDPRSRETGQGVTVYELLHGLVQHDAYHSGQIALVRKAVAAGS